MVRLPAWASWTLWLRLRLWCQAALGFGWNYGGGLGGAPGEFAGVYGGVAAAGGVFLEEGVQFFDGRFVGLRFVQAGGDFFVVGRALFKVGLGLLVALDDFRGQVLAFQVGAGCFEF